MRTYRCPVCKKPLTKEEYEKALRIHRAREEHLSHLEEDLRKRERDLPDVLMGHSPPMKKKGAAMIAPCPLCCLSL